MPDEEAILAVLTATGRPMSTSEIGAVDGLPRSSYARTHLDRLLRKGLVSSVDPPDGARKGTRWWAFSGRVTKDQLVQALALIDEPEMPIDGDCLKLQPRVTDALRARHWPVLPVTVIGWANADRRLIAFAHQATECAGWIVDFTARMFNDQLPARWITPVSSYKVELASMAGVATVTVARYRENVTKVTGIEGPDD